MTKPLDVVFVCTGNRFRSPLAEAVFRRGSVGVPVRVGSYGTLDVGPAPALDEAVREARLLGVDLAEHRARPLRGADLAAADLVVGFERMHLVSAVVDAHAPLQAVFTLPELVLVLDAIDPPSEAAAVERARRLLAAADRPRPRDVARWRPPELDDPLGRSLDVQRELAQRVHALTTRLVTQLFGTTRSESFTARACP